MPTEIWYFSPWKTWRSLPDSNEISKDFPGVVVNSVEATLDRLAASNIFFIAKRKNANQDVFYFSAKLPQGVPFLIELTTVIGTLGVKCAIKTPGPEMAPLFFEAVETLLKGWKCFCVNVHNFTFHYSRLLSVKSQLVVQIFAWYFFFVVFSAVAVFFVILTLICSLICAVSWDFFFQ